MPIVRWQPFRDLLALQERMNRLFEDRLTRVRGEESLTGTSLPPVDIYETQDALILEADIPGLELNDLDLRVEDNTLTVRGERKAKVEVEQESYHRVERTYGSFSRSFSLPHTVDPEKISATYENGVLRLTMGKREESKPKQIRVEVKQVGAAGEKKQVS